MKSTAADGELSLGRPPLKTVLLHHFGDSASDVGDHFDWMIARDAHAKQPLITFRAAVRIDHLRPGEQAVVERIANHRPQYLEYEGPIGPDGERGRVIRIAEGMVITHRPRETGELELSINWGDRQGTASNAASEKVGGPMDQPVDEQIVRILRTNASQWLVICDRMQQQRR